MKQLIYTTAIFIAILLSSCMKEDLSTNVNDEGQNPSKSKDPQIQTDANPVIANMGYVTIGKGSKAVSYNTIAVMDENGANQTHLYYSAGLYFNPGFRYVGGWSPNGTNICFIEGVNGGMKVRKLTVTMVNGVPTGTDLTDLVTYSASDSVWIRNIGWSPSISNPEIAYSKTKTSPADWSKARTSLMLVPENGGIPSELYFEIGTAINSLTWSPDGSKIAILLYSYISTERTIKIIERSTGQVLNSYNLGTGNIQYLSWSRTGQNKLVFNTTISRYENYLYTFDLNQSNPSPVLVSLNSGAVPTHPNWSADNSKIIYWDNAAYPNYGLKTVNLMTNAITKINNSSIQNGYPDWKR